MHVNNNLNTNGGLGIWLMNNTSVEQYFDMEI